MLQYNTSVTALDEKSYTLLLTLGLNMLLTGRYERIAVIKKGYL